MELYIKLVESRVPPAFNRERSCHLALCLWLILFHSKYKIGSKKWNKIKKRRQKLTIHGIAETAEESMMPVVAAFALTHFDFFISKFLSNFWFFYRMKCWNSTEAGSTFADSLLLIGREEGRRILFENTFGRKIKFDIKKNIFSIQWNSFL